MPPTNLASVADNGIGLNSETRKNIRRKREILQFVHVVLNMKLSTWNDVMGSEEIKLRTDLMNALKPSVQR